MTLLVHRREAMRGPTGSANGWSPTGWLLLICLSFSIYTLMYFAMTALPGNPSAPAGWWDWFDQSQYLRSARSFTDGTYRHTFHFYPPAYSWLGSYFIRIWPAHPFFLVNFSCLMLHVVSLLLLGRRFASAWVVGCGVAAAFLLFPSLTLWQWEIPWTTSLSSGVAAAMFLIFLYFYERAWRCTSLLDWGLAGSYGLLCGVLSATRPIDCIVYVPLSIVFYVSLLVMSAAAEPRRAGALWRVAALLAYAAVSLSIVPLLYAIFNWRTTGTLLGTYVTVAGNNGFEFRGLLRKFISLFTDSSAVFVEPRQSLVDQFYPMSLAIPLLLWTMWRAPLPLRLIAVAIGLQFAIYVPYTDLLPNGMFHYFNVHYFSWTFPWLMVFLFGSIERWARACASSRGRAARAWSIAQAIGLALLGLAFVNLRLRPLPTTTLAAAVAGRNLAVDLIAPQRLDFIDLSGVGGDWTSVYFGDFAVAIGTKPLKWVTDYRAIPTRDGIRVVFNRRRAAQRISLTLPPGVSANAPVLARAAAVHVSLWCRLQSCQLPALRPPLATSSQRARKT